MVKLSNVKLHIKISLVLLIIGLLLVLVSLVVKADTINFPSAWQGNFNWQKGMETVREKDFVLAYGTQDDGTYLMSVLGRVNSYSSSQSAEGLLTYNLMQPKPAYEIYAQKNLSDTESIVLTTETGKAYVEGIYLRNFGNNCYGEVVYMASARTDVTSASFEKLKADLEQIVEKGTIINYLSLHDTYNGFCPTVAKATAQPASPSSASKQVSPSPSEDSLAGVIKPSPTLTSEPNNSELNIMGGSSKTLKMVGLGFVVIAVGMSIASLIYNFVLRRRGRDYV